MINFSSTLLFHLRHAAIVLGLIALVITIAHFIGIDTAQAALIDPSDTTYKGGYHVDPPRMTQLESLIRAADPFLLPFLGLIVMIMFIYGGFLYVRRRKKIQQLKEKNNH